MNSLTINQAFTRSFTPGVTLTDHLSDCSKAILNILQIHLTAVATTIATTVATYLESISLFRKYPPFLPSIYLFNLKQTKLFAFIIL